MSKRFVPVKSPYLVPADGSFRVKHADTSPRKSDRDDAANEEALAAATEKLRRLQGRLAASGTHTLLLVFQAMDAAGKDGTIKAVMTGVNPAGVTTHWFKRPTERELGHDFLWRCQQCLPPRGWIGIWNRSHYEEVLVVKVHPEILASQRIPNRPDDDRLFEERYQSIRDFELHLARNGTRILKFWLNVGRSEQRKRFLERIADPESNWKFEAQDVRERKHWKKYMAAYQDALNETSRPWAPWYAVPADDKKFMRQTIADIVVRTLESMKLEYPDASPDTMAEMARAKVELESE
jgi:PPK2 family polyphosphate:nucleotide phosphotransferase